MKLIQLIMLDTPIIVSDEKIKPGDWYRTNLSNIYQETERMFEDDEGKPRFHYPQYKKIIAGIKGLPSINWNGLEEEFGWIDVEKLAINATKKQMIRIFGNESKEEIEDDIQKRKYYFKEGFKKAQSLNEKKFSLEDMKQAIEIAKLSVGIDNDGETCYSNKSTEQIIQSIQQPKVFDIEVEMYRPNEAYQIREHWSPKITNNSIKIIKKL